MADEATDALIPEAPSTEATPDAGAPAPDPFEQRYESARKELDRKNTLIDRATKGDVEAIRALGFEYDEPDNDPTPDEYEDPYAQKFSQTEKELAELKAWRAEREAEALYNRLNSHVDSLAKDNDFALSQQDRNYILSQAAADGEISSEKTEAAFKAHMEYVNAIREASSPQTAPDRPGTGQAAIKQFDPVNATDEERLAYMEARMRGAPVT